MADKRGKEFSVQQGGYCSCAAAAGAVKPGGAVEDTRNHQFLIR